MLVISYSAILVAALVNFVLGFLLHGPIGGKLWMKLAQIHPTGKEKMSDMYGQMVWNLLVNLVAAYVIAMFFALFKSTPYFLTGGGASNVSIGMIIAFWCWLGFVVTSTSIDVIWMGKSFKLWAYEAMCSFICFLAMGAVIGMW